MKKLLIASAIVAAFFAPQAFAQAKNFEGFSATPYPDHKGYSVGFGHLIKAGETLDTVTREQAEGLLLGDVAWAEQAVRTAVHVDLDQNEFDALVSLAYNIGAGAFKNSTLVKKLNSGDFEEIGMNRQLGYSSPADIIDKYPAFFWNSVSMHLDDGISQHDGFRSSVDS